MERCRSDGNESEGRGLKARRAKAERARQTRGRLRWFGRRHVVDDGWFPGYGGYTLHPSYRSVLSVTYRIL